MITPSAASTVADCQLTDALVIRDENAPSCGGQLQHLIIRMAGTELGRFGHIVPMITQLLDDKRGNAFVGKN